MNEGLLVLGACFVVGFIAFSFILAPKKPQAQKPALEPRGAPVPGQAAWYVVLGVAENSSVEAIQAAYQRQMQAYHPDEMAVFNPGLQRMAEQKVQEIAAAYETAMRLRGIGKMSWR